jgi:GT2 family glycosyltransferase
MLSLDRTPLVISIILNTNRREDTLACLESLSQTNYPNQQVLVLDNASVDGSVEAIQSRFPQIQIVNLTENKGYTGNNNLGIATALDLGAEWVFLLNEDVVLDPDSISEMIHLAISDPIIGVVGPLVYHFDQPKVIQSAGGILDANWHAHHAGQNEPDTGQYSDPRPVDWISGCAILVRREVIEQIGALDERFFYYWEETEWCIRAAKAGWRIFLVPQAKVWHKGVQVNYKPGPNVTYYWTRNRLMALAKHHAPLRAWLYTLTDTLRTLASWTFRPRWRNQRPHRDAMWQGMVDFMRHHWGMRSS